MIFAKPNADVIEIRFRVGLDMEVFRDYVDRIKRINGRRFISKDNDTYWVIPIAQQGYLKSLFDRKEIEWEQEEVGAIAPKKISDDLTHMDELKLQPYPFQAIGINFLCDTKTCLLADEMGLGKTIQSIAGVYKLWRQGKAKKSLIVCPSSLKYQWSEEIGKFLDTEKYGIEHVVIDGTPKKRVATYDYIHNNDNVLYAIINYELVLNDIDYLLEFDWDVISLDEAHRIRNWKSQTSKAIKKLDATYKWAATGTPVQNKADEVFNIFAWINPDILGNWWKFRNTHIIIGTKFGQPNMPLGNKNLGLLHKKISPYMLRRLKKDVAPELPEMLINNYYVDMYKEQFKLHEEIREELFAIIKEVSKFTERDENGNIIKQHPKANQTLGMFTMLQEVCDSPELLQISESRMAQRYAISKNKSPKLSELYKILEDFLASHEGDPEPAKAVIFTQFSKMQSIIVDHISKLGKCEIINGSMKAADKQEHMVNFKMNPEIRFIVCTDAANYGVNLQEACLLINFDMPWNPAVWQQRNARIHRINSEHDSINIINLISREGLDERILDVIYDKQTMADAIIENRDGEKQYLSSLTSNMMSKLLKNKKKKK